MSFIYQSITVTLDNYKDIFKGYPVDIFDEIRSAVLDSTNIAPFIDSCRDDSYKLGQIRMALRELIPLQYINKSFTGKTIYYIRYGIQDGVDMSSLLTYIEGGEPVLPIKTLEKLAQYIYIGTDISSVDFRNVPTHLVDIFCTGLHKNYPMYLFLETTIPYTEEYIQTIMRGMQLGIDVHPFLTELWEQEKLHSIFAKAHHSKININELLSYINNKFDIYSIEYLLEFMKQGIPIATLCIKDKNGYPIYNQYQIYELGSAIQDGTISNEMYNSDLSDFEMHEMRVKNS